MRIDWPLYHVASGHTFFVGAALVAVSVLLRTLSTGRRRSANLLTFLGVLGIALSATPLPWPVYAAWVGLLGLWLRIESRAADPTRRRRLIAARAAALSSCVVATLLELPYHIAPSPRRGPVSVIGVIGDSVTAGMGENEAVTWPRLLARRHDLVVDDRSAMGATVASARKQAAQLDPSDRVIVIEIGGNDLLGSTSVADFESGLDALLRDVARPGRTVLLFELPLPPGFNAYGRAQRRQAAKHGVTLIPKRVLMGVLTDPGATLDTIHLSQAGHDRMAEVVAKILGFGPATGANGSSEGEEGRQPSSAVGDPAA